LNFQFSGEELALQSEARRFLEAQGTLKLAREMLDGRGEAQAARLWNQVAALGWPAASIPEAYGGLGLSHVSLCAIAEEVGRAAAPLPMMASVYLASEALVIAGSEAQKSQWLSGIAAGNIIGTLALAGDFTVREGRLSGEVAPIPYALAAGIALVTAKGEGSDTGLYLVDLTEAGVQRMRIMTIDESSPHGKLVLSNVPCERLGSAGDGQHVLDEVKRRAAVLVAFEQVGGAEACLDMAVAYARQRRSFGKVIASYQAIKHRLAEIYIKKELARSNAYYAAWALSKQDANLELAATTARVSATDAYEFAAAENIQVHGGFGFTWDADCQIHYRRSRLLALALGTISEWQDRLITAVDAKVAV
jgi:alkylation response protein AidB-like acyl-CoA dehydrogenase